MSDSIGEHLGILAIGILGSFGMITCLRTGADYFSPEPKEAQTILTAEELVASVKPYKYEDYYSDEQVTQTAINCLQTLLEVSQQYPDLKLTYCYVTNFDVTNFDSRYRAPLKIFQQYVANVVSLLEKAHYKVELVEGSEDFPNTRHRQRLKVSWK
jgi:hypothetical protein